MVGYKVDVTFLSILTSLNAKFSFQFVLLHTIKHILHNI